MHAASSLLTEEEVSGWPRRTPVRPLPEPTGKLTSLKPLADDEAACDPLGQVILRRSSTRRFARGKAVTFGQLSTILYRAMQGIPADFLDPVGIHINQIYLIVHAAWRVCAAPR